MILRIIFSAGQVATVLYNCARARADRLAELEGYVAHSRREIARLRGLLRISQDDLAASEQRCNLLAHRVEEAESDVRHWALRGDTHKRRAARWKAYAKRCRLNASECAVGETRALHALGEAQEQRDGLRLDLSMAETRVRDLEQALADGERARELLRGERDAAQAKVELYQRGEDATRAMEGES